jgi:hypothetical protein
MGHSGTSYGNCGAPKTITKFKIFIQLRLSFFLTAGMLRKKKIWPTLFAGG